MKPLILMSALFLTACAAPEPFIRTEYVKPDVPDVLHCTLDEDRTGVRDSLHAMSRAVA